MIPIPREDTPWWTDEELLQCVMVIPEAPNVRTFAFRAPSGGSFRYRPGQFLTFELPLPDGPIYRTYSISSSPSQSLSISITVKAQANSKGSRWMIDNLRPGATLKVTGPAGVFTLPHQPDGKYLFIAAGSGVTPLMSMLSFLFDRGEEPDVAFIVCARRPSELIFRSRLEHMASRIPGIKLHFVVNKEDQYTVWTGYRGRLNQLMLGLMAPDYLEREVFCCGPETFMQSVRDMLHALGYDMENYFQESFCAPTLQETQIDLDDVVPQDDVSAEVVFAASRVTAQCTQTDTVLAVAKATGLNIPSGCTFGICGTCKVKKLAGEVHMVHNGGISEEDIESGYILACCSNPLGQVEIEV